MGARPRAARLDLHMHSDRSDGKWPPDAVLARAAEGDLDHIALTDHDLPNALPAGPHSVGGRTVRVIAGAEVSGSHERREYHLLVYFPDEMPFAYREWVRSRARARAVRYDAALDALGYAGIPRSTPEARAGEVALTRHHLARVLLGSGHFASQGEAWKRLGDGGAVPLVDVTFVEAIRVARAFGALTSWAHPTLVDAQRYLGTFVAAGLEGLEGLRPRTDRSTRNALKRLADRHHLLLTGGSDWHGWMDDRLGLFAVSGERADAFLRRLDAPRAVA